MINHKREQTQFFQHRLLLWICGQVDKLEFENSLFFFSSSWNYLILFFLCVVDFLWRDERLSISNATVAIMVRRLRLYQIYSHSIFMASDEAMSECVCSVHTNDTNNKIKTNERIGKHAYASARVRADTQVSVSKWPTCCVLDWVSIEWCVWKRKRCHQVERRRCSRAVPVHCCMYARLIEVIPGN